MSLPLLTAFLCALPPSFSEADFTPSELNLEQIKHYGFSVKEPTTETEGMLYIISNPSLRPSSDPKRKYKIFKDFDSIDKLTLESMQVPPFSMFKEMNATNLPMRTLTYKITYKSQTNDEIQANTPQTNDEIQVLAMSLNHVRFGENFQGYVDLKDVLLNKEKKTLQIAYVTQPLELKYKYGTQNYYFDFGGSLSYAQAPDDILKVTKHGHKRQKMSVFYKVAKKPISSQNNWIPIDTGSTPYYKNLIGVNGWGQKESLAVTANKGLAQ